MNLAVSPNDLQLALVENHATDDSMGADSCVRYYEIGRSKADDAVTGLEVSETDFLLKFFCIFSVTWFKILILSTG